MRLANLAIGLLLSWGGASSSLAASPPDAAGPPAFEAIVQSGHSDLITAVASSSDGRLAATTSRDGSAKVWDVRTGQVLATVSAGAYWMHSVAFSPTGDLLATGSGDHDIYLWQLATGRLAGVLETHAGAPQVLAFSPDGKLLASSGRHGIGIWDVAGKRRIDEFSLPGFVLALAFIPGTPLLAIQNDTRLLLWNRTTHGPVAEVADHNIGGRALLVSRDGTRIASLGWNAKIERLEKATSYSDFRMSTNVWNVSTTAPGLAPLATLRDFAALRFDETHGGLDGLTTGIGYFTRDTRAFNLPWPGGPSAVAHCDPASATCEKVPGTPPVTFEQASMGATQPWIVAVQGQKVQALSMANDGAAPVFPDRTVNAVTALAVDPDSGAVAIGLRNGAISVWDRRWQWQAPLLGWASDGPPVAVTALQFAGEGPGLLAGHAADGRSTRWSLAGDAKATELQPRGAESAQDSVSGLREELDLKRPAAPKALRVEVAGGAPPPRSDTLPVAAISRAGRLVASGGHALDGARQFGVVVVRSLDDGHVLHEIQDAQRDTQDVVSLAFSPRGDLLAIGFEGGGIDVWKLATREIVARAEGHLGPVQSLAFDPASATLASGGADHGVRLWDAHDFHALHVLESHALGVSSLAFSPDGRWLASGGADGLIALDDLRDAGGHPRWLAGHTSAVTSLAFDGGRGLLLSGSADATVRFWRPGTDHPLLVLLPPDGHGSWLANSSAGFFDGPERSWPRMMWRFRSEPWTLSPVEIGFREYFLPDLLAKAIDDKLPEPCRDLASLRRERPSVRVSGVRVAGQATDAGPRVDVTVAARDDPGRSGVYALELFRDGKRVFSAADAADDAELVSDGEACETAAATWRERHRVAAQAGSGEIEQVFHDVALARAGDGWAGSFSAFAFNGDQVKGPTSPAVPFSVPGSPGGGHGPARGRAFLVTVGVNANESHWTLDLAVSSARSVQALLGTWLQGRFKEVVEVPLLADFAPDSTRVAIADARKSAIETVFDILSGRAVSSQRRDLVDPRHRLSAATPDDAVVLYVASHGYSDPQGRFIAIPYDTGPGWGVTQETLAKCAASTADARDCAASRAFVRNAISSADLARWWRRIDAGTQVMILDTCFSGAALGKAFRPGPLGDPGLGQLIYDKGMLVLLAAQPTQTANGDWIDEGVGKTLLATALARTTDPSADASLPVWFERARRAVPRMMARDYPELPEAARQLPELLDFSQRGD